MTVHETKFGIRPEFVYRKTDPETLRILGLRSTAIDDAIARGDIPPPAPLTASGRSVGWYGFTLIQVIERRLAAASSQRRAPPPQLNRKKKKAG
jgi:predicted DNA-binding transcriptional regulator AlpA